jgi:FtsP/CotA-like multicopper oxidase with cupredoxin domain
MTDLPRRRAILGGLGLAATAALAACSRQAPVFGGAAATGRAGSPVSPAPTTDRAADKNVVRQTIVAKPITLDLGGPTVSTWAYDEALPGRVLRATAGDTLEITLDNQLPAETTIHWHGIRVANHADGVPGLTQDPVKAGGRHVYRFTAPDPGTYFFHPHVGVQLDRGLYAPLIIDDPREPGEYDTEWVVVLDDWIDGAGTTPDQVLKDLTAGTGGGSTATGSMGGMDHGSMGGMGMGNSPWGDAGDVTYPYFLINGKIAAAPDVLNGKPGQRVRLRIINAASDTIFTVALGGHRMTITHTDGWPVQPTNTDALYIGMGERYDAIVTLKDGAFPLVARPFGKNAGGQGLALIRSGGGAAPAADITPTELEGRALIGSELTPADSARLVNKQPDATDRLTLQGSMNPYRWGINGAPYGTNKPLTVAAGQRLRIDAVNMSMMTHPLHVHGHTFALPSGLRKDTVLMAPMQRFPIDLDADNKGNWMIHCHNIYHAEAGMMIALKYTS